ncbi:MAG: T9SS type A sorting domain-containing protein [Flavobacteriales bacterium]
MKTVYTILFSCIAFTTTAQFSFSDDFESYSNGDYIGVENVNWSTWSGTTGNNEDAQVTTDNASSGTQSIYFTSTSANGGPQDVILPFGEVFEQGDFIFSANFFVENNTGAYFNFQAETTVGNTWAMDCFMNDDGSIEFSTGGGATTFLTGSYPFDSWFNLELSINLTLNQWEVLIDGNSIGSFSNTVNAVASLDIFPLSGHSFFLDDVEVSHAPFNPVGINAILTQLSTPTYVQIPTNVDIQGTVLNYGAETITAMDIVWTDGTNTYTDNLSGLSIQTLDTYDFIHSDQLVLNTLDTANITVTIENINSGTDLDISNNIIDMTIIGVEFVTQRIPLYEHFTSNTCGPCASFNPGFQTLLDANNVNDLTSAKVGAIKYQVNWPGSADQSYNGDVASRVKYYAVNSVPFAHIDGTPTSSSQAEIDSQRNEPSFLDISGTAVATDGTELAIEVSVSSYTDLPNATIHIAIVENEYTNTAGTNGESEFFQVMRKMLPSAEGTSANLSYGSTTNISESVSIAVGNVTADSYRIWEDLDNCIIVVFVQDEDTKEVIHAKFIDITGNTTVIPTWSCEANGCIDPGTGQGEYSSLQDCESKCISDISYSNISDFRFSPNPASEYISLTFNSIAKKFSLSIHSLNGQRVFEKQYGNLEAQQQIDLDISGLKPSIYLVKIQYDDEIELLQFIKQ